jgi:hypothetical protein
MVFRWIFNVVSGSNRAALAVQYAVDRVRAVPAG